MPSPASIWRVVAGISHLPMSDSSFLCIKAAEVPAQNAAKPWGRSALGRHQRLEMPDRQRCRLFSTRVREAFDGKVAIIADLVQGAQDLRKIQLAAPRIAPGVVGQVDIAEPRAGLPDCGDRVGLVDVHVERVEMDIAVVETV